MAVKPNASKRINAYIATKPAFARPILKELRKIIHQADPKIVENWKWGPAFERDGLVCGIFGFKRWVSIWFYNGAKIKDVHKLFSHKKNLQMRSINITSLDQVRKHQRHLIQYIQTAVKNNLAGVKRAAPRPRKAKRMPADLKRALSRRGLARAYAARPPYQQRDYVQWVAGAKQAVTRENRLEKMLEELEDGHRYMGMKY